MVSVAAIIAQQHRCATICGNQEIQITIIVDISVGSTPGHAWCIECRANGFSGFFKAVSLAVVKEMRRLTIFDLFLDFLYLVFNMSIGDKDIRPAVKVIIKEEAAKSQRKQGSTPNRSPRCLIHKQTVPFIVVKGHHLIGKICDNDAWTARMVIIRSIHAHTRACNAIFTEGNPRCYSCFSKGAVMIVEI